MHSLARSWTTSLRFVVDWTLVQPNEGQWDWSYYIHVALQAASRELHVLPIVINCPGWLERQQISPNLYYPKPTEHVAFGQFAAETLQFFDQFGVARAIEIWNEPNLNKFFVPADVYATMLHQALTTIDARKYSRDMTVISGGLEVSGSPQNRGDTYWSNYYYDFYLQCFPYAVGIHPYGPLSFSAADTQTTAIDKVVDKSQGEVQCCGRRGSW